MVFAQYAQVIVFFHVLSAVVWIGGMITIRLVVHPALATIESPELKLGKTLEITGRLFMLVIPFIVTILLTALIMLISIDGHHGALKDYFFLKEAIWVVMVLNFGYMFVRRRKAWQHYRAREFPEAKRLVRLFPNLLLPINIILGFLALWLGISLRGI
jgi:uncharacterized membrane protein